MTGDNSAIAFLFTLTCIGVVSVAAIGVQKLIDRTVRRHVDRALDAEIPYLPVERALRRHPSNVHKIESRVRVK